MTGALDVEHTHRSRMFSALMDHKEYDPTFVYVMSRKNSDIVGPTKIGMARNPQRRLLSIQTATPFPICLFKTFHLPTRVLAREIEAHFHRAFIADHLHGEWFNIGPAKAEKRVKACVAVAIQVQLSALTSDEQIAVYDFIVGDPS